ncbi:hypothetical protein SAMN02982994_5424 [Azospirillum lipoferum]|nr:hypothetical protein SAMN02982994_5424 [Azospirillum lipoferum]
MTAAGATRATAETKLAFVSWKRCFSAALTGQALHRLRRGERIDIDTVAEILEREAIAIRQFLAGQSTMGGQG